MKIMKYLVAALLVVSITKKVHVQPNTITKNKQVVYDSKNKTAKTNTTYVGVVQYNRAVTPPNIAIPALKFFATIPTPNYKPSKNYAGGLNTTTRLFGIPVTGQEYKVKSDSKSIGFYWPANKIVQLNDGQTFVEVKEEMQKNYTAYHALGPISTRFMPSESKELFKMYNIVTTDENFKDSVKTIGSIKKGNQIVKLYGVLLNATPMPEITEFFDKTQKAENVLKNLQTATVPDLNSINKQLRLKIATAYHNRQHPDNQLTASNSGMLFATEA